MTRFEFQMDTNKRSLKKKLAVIAIMVSIFSCIICGIFVFQLLTPFSGDALMIPQDCLLVERDIAGQISDVSGDSINNATVFIQNIFGKGYEAGKVNLTLPTDADGRFGKKAVPVFACDVLQFRITASGHKDTVLKFDAAAEYISGVTNVDLDGYGKESDYAESNGSLPLLPRRIIITLP